MVKYRQKIPMKSLLKSMMVLAIPVACQNLLTNTGSMVDTIMIGSIGQTSVGAVGLCAQFSSLMLNCYWGLLGGGMLFFSQYFGANDERRLNQSYGLMFVSMMFVGIVFGVAAVFFPAQIMGIYTDKQVYIDIGKQYLPIVGFAYPLQVWSMAASGLFRSTRRVKIPLAASIVSVCTNTFLNWVFIFGNLGMPRLGVRGAAIATLIAAVANVAVIYILSAKRDFNYLFNIAAHYRWSVASIKRFYKKCLPIIANELAMGVANLILNMVLGRQAVEAVAALAVFRVFEGLIIAFFTGFSNATAVIVGNDVGAGKLEEAFYIANKGVYLCAGTIFGAVMLIFACNQPLLTLMGLSGDAFSYASQMLLVYCVIATLRMSNWISNDICRSSGDAITGTMLEIVFMYVLNLPLLCLGGFVWHLPFLLCFLFAYIDEPIRFVIMQIHMHAGGWVRPVTKEGKAELPKFRADHPLKFFFCRMGLKA